MHSLHKKLTLMAVLLLQSALLTRSRHIGVRSTSSDEDEPPSCPPRNMTSDAAACFISDDLARRLRVLFKPVEHEKNIEVGRAMLLPQNESFRTWHLDWESCPDDRWRLSYLLTEALKGRKYFERDVESVGQNMNNNLFQRVKSLFTELHCEVKSITEHCPLFSGHPVISTESTDTSEQPWKTNTTAEFVVAKFWVVWEGKLRCIRDFVDQLYAGAVCVNKKN